MPDSRPPPRPAPAPRRCFWELTRACDHACIHCRVSAGRPGAEELDADEALDVADQLVEMGVPLVVLTGGEPTAFPRWSWVARRLVDGGCRVRLFSTGTALDKATVERALAAGIEEFAVSLDGPQPIHDRLRPTRGVMGGSSFARTVDAIDRLVARELSLRVVTVASQINVEYLDDTYFLLRNHGVVRWQINLCQNAGRAREAVAELMPGPGDLQRIVDVLLRASREGVITSPMHCTVGYMTAEEPVLRRPLSTRQLVWRGTPAGLRTMAITASGGVLGCTALPDEFVTASVRDRTLRDIWGDDACFPYSRAFEPSILAGLCAQCELAPLCRAGCPAVAYGATGAVGANPYCLRLIRSDQ